VARKAECRLNERIQHRLHEDIVYTDKSECVYQHGATQNDVYNYSVDGDCIENDSESISIDPDVTDSLSKGDVHPQIDVCGIERNTVDSVFIEKRLAMQNDLHDVLESEIVRLNRQVKELMMSKQRQNEVSNPVESPQVSTHVSVPAFAGNCFNCYKPAHHSRNCTAACRVCLSLEHSSYVCPQRRSQRGGHGNQNNNNNGRAQARRDTYKKVSVPLDHKVLGSLCEVNARINGTPCLTLVDSGSQVTLVSRSYYENYLKNVLFTPLDEVLNIAGISDDVTSYDGVIELEVSFPMSVFNDVSSRQILAVVAKNTEYSDRVPVTAGTNWIGLYQGKIPHKYVNKNGKNNSHDSRRMVQALKAVSKFRGSGDLGKATAILGGPLMVKPQQTVTLPAYMRAGPNGYRCEVLVDDDNYGGRRSNPGLKVTPMLTLAECGRYHSELKVIVCNDSVHPVCVKPGQVIANVRSVLEVKSVPVAPGNEDNNNKPGLRRVLNCGGLDFDLTRSPIDDEQAVKVSELLNRNHLSFSKFENDLGRCDLVKHQIKLKEGAVPSKQTCRRVPPALYDEIQQQIKGMLQNKVIRNSVSAWSAPLVLVAKKDKTTRICVDYRKLNDQTIPDAYALPRIEEGLDLLKGAKWFTTIDLKSGFWQIAMEEADIEKTAFASPFGHFEFTATPFGLRNAGATCQRTVEKCLGDLNNRICQAYFDDVIIFSETFDEHLVRLEKVLGRLRDCDLKIKHSKCQLFMNKVKYLGHIVSFDGVETDPEKTAALKEWPVPKDVRETRKFLGFGGYYRRYIANYSDIARPLNDLLQGQPTKRNPERRILAPVFVWTGECQKAFDSIINQLCSAPILAYADYTKPFELHTDASGVGLGAALYQMNMFQGKERLMPVAFASRSLSKSEKNYPAHKLEFLALKWAVTEKFQDYCCSGKVRVLTDNNPLTYVNTTAKLDATGHRWIAALANYDLTISYRPGRNNGDADALSRRPKSRLSSPDESTHRFVDTIKISSEEVKAIGKRYETEDESTSWVEAISCSAHAVIPEYCQEASDENTKSLYKMSSVDWRREQGNDPNIARLKFWVNNKTIPTRLERMQETVSVRQALREINRLTLRDGVIYRTRRDSRDGKFTYQLVLPKRYHGDAMYGLHNGAGHLGNDRTLEALRQRFYWPRMAEDTKEHIRRCKRCSRRKDTVGLKRQAPMMSIITTQPMELVCLDFLSLEPSAGGIKDILVISDHFTKFAMAIPTRNQTAKTTAKHLYEGFILHYGIPLRLHSDQGRNFESRVIRELCVLLGIEKSRTTPYHPSGNGQCERFNKSLLNMLGTMENEKKGHWKDYVSQLVHAYNCSKHDSTNYSPYYLLFGRESRLPVDIELGVYPNDNGIQKPLTSYVDELREKLTYAHGIVKNNIVKRGGKNKKLYDLKVRDSTFEPGDWVLMKNVNLQGKIKIADRWESDAYKVIKRLGENSPVYMIQTVRGKKRTVHRNFLKPCYDVISGEDSDSDGEIVVTPKRRSKRNRVQKVDKTVHSSTESSDEGELWSFVNQSILNANVVPFLPGNVTAHSSSEPSLSNKDTVEIIVNTTGAGNSESCIGTNSVDSANQEVSDVNTVGAAILVTSNSDDIGNGNLDPDVCESNPVAAAILDNHDNTEVGSCSGGSDNVETGRVEFTPRRSERVRRPTSRYGYSAKRVTENKVNFDADSDLNWRKSCDIISTRFEDVFGSRVIDGCYQRR
jgi:transposase InsO family protein